MGAALFIELRVCANTTYAVRTSTGTFPLVRCPRVELGFSCIPSKQITVFLAPEARFSAGIMTAQLRRNRILFRTPCLESTA